MIASSDLMNILPDELLLRIFQFVDKEDLVHSVQYVCPRWQSVAQDKSLWKDYNYSPPAKTRDKAVSQFLEQSPQLKSFTMSSEMDVNEIVDVLCKRNKQLKTLNISMKNKLNLRLLKGVFTRIPSLDCLSISQAPKLDPKITVDKRFCVKFLNSNDLHPKMLYFTESMNFGVKNTRFTDVLKYILKKKKEDIVFVETNMITDDILKLLEECKSVENLILRFDQYQDCLKSNLEYIRNFPRLKSLSIVGYFNDSLMNDLFSKGTMGSVQELELSWCVDLSDNVAKNIRMCCPNLEILSLDNCLKVTDKGIQELTKCSNLRHVVLSSCPLLTSESVKQVCKCHSLTHLDISSFPADISEYIGHLISAKQIRNLNLKGNRINESYLRVLRMNLRKLSNIYVDMEINNQNSQ